MLRAAAAGEPLRVSSRRETEIRWITENCLAAILCHLTEQGEDSALCSSDKQLQGARLTTKFLTKTLLSAMTEIIDRCQPRVEKIVLLKGISISDQYYPAPDLRPMRDIDFLVEKKDLVKIEEVLIQLGYQQKSDLPKNFFDDYHHSMPFYNPNTGVWVEVHTGLFSAKKQVHGTQAFCMNNVQDNLVKSIFNEREVYRLSDEYQLLYTASHWCLEFRQFGGSIALFDIVYLLKNTPALDWARILSWLDNDQLGWCLFIVLGYLKQNNILDIDNKLFHKLKPQNKIGDSVRVKILYYIIDKYRIAGYPFGNVITSGNVGIIWGTLLRGNHPVLCMLSLPFNLLFPPNNPKRFNLRYQMQRLRNCFRLSNNEK